MNCKYTVRVPNVSYVSAPSSPPTSSGALFDNSRAPEDNLEAKVIFGKKISFQTRTTLLCADRGSQNPSPSLFHPAHHAS